MKERKLYTCEFCNTDFASKEKALECERNHKLVDKVNISCVYKSKNSIPDGFPVKIRLTFKDKCIEYHR